MKSKRTAASAGITLTSFCYALGVFNSAMFSVLLRDSSIGYALIHLAVMIFNVLTGFYTMKDVKKHANSMGELDESIRDTERKIAELDEGAPISSDEWDIRCGKG